MIEGRQDDKTEREAEVEKCRQHGTKWREGAYLFWEVVDQLTVDETIDTVTYNLLAS